MDKQHSKKQTMKTPKTFIQTSIKLAGLLLFALFLSSSCTKEIDNWIDKKAETINDTLRTLPDARIIEYKVANVSDQPIYSTVDDSLKTITVYLPSYYELGIIQPEIKLPQGTTINPSTDTPVPVFSETPFTYEVTSAKGQKSTYTLEVIVQQPTFKLNELSTATSTYKVTKGNIALAGTNFLPNFSVSKAYLYDTEGNLVGQLVPNGNTTPTTTLLNYTYGEFYGFDVPTGTYYIELRSYAITKRMQYPILLERYAN